MGTRLSIGVVPSVFIAAQNTPTSPPPGQGKELKSACLHDTNMMQSAAQDGERAVAVAAPTSYQTQLRVGYLACAGFLPELHHRLDYMIHTRVVRLRQ